MDWIWYGAILVAGFFCGMINTLAGSGSLITLPLLIFMGLPANVANGTNRIGILLQNLVSTASFKKHKVLDFQRGKWLAIPSVAGSLLGAMIAVDLDERAMRLLIAMVMVVMLGVILVKPKRWLAGNETQRTPKPTWLELLIYFAIGIYGGLIQAGVGIFLLAGLVLVSGYDLVRANAVKVLIILGFTPFALAVFILNDQVRWGVGLWLAVGNMLGAWAGAQAAVKKGAGFVRWVLIIVIALSALKLMLDVF